MTGSVDNLWYVLVENQSYGPYNMDHMIGFISEGRVLPNSLVSAYPQSGFLPASQHPVFQHWVNTSAHAQTPQFQPQQQVQSSAQHNPTTQYSPATQPDSTVKEGPQDNIFLIMAEVNPKTGMNFLRRLQNYGHVQRIGDAFWLLKSAHGLTDIKASLAETLTKRDRLFIHDCFSNQQSWENIGADLDDRIRQIWGGLKR